MNPFIWLIFTLIDLYSLAVFVWVIVELLLYFNILNRGQRAVQLIYYALNRLILPALRPIRQVLPPMGGLDLSPIILLIGLQFLQRLLVYYF